jgi:8-hydroxy-5-deazaflavin:NADPH oxidoreductase
LRGMPERADCRPVQGASASIWMSFGSPLVERPPYVGVLQEQARGRLSMGEFPDIGRRRARHTGARSRLAPGCGWASARPCAWVRRYVGRLWPNSAGAEGNYMKIAVVGRGNVGGGLADLWEAAGHELTRIGREGGDVSDAEAVVVAVPGGTIAQALEGVDGLGGKTVIDATNLVGVEPPEGFSSNAEYVKSRTGGPTAKSFNANFASLYDRVGGASSRPSNMWCGEEEAREVVERLNRDAGYEPLSAGPLENASVQEQFIKLIFGIAGGGMGQFLYRMAPPERL